MDYTINSYTKADGMMEAAKTVGEIGLSVLKNLDKLVPILDKIS